MLNELISALNSSFKTINNAFSFFTNSSLTDKMNFEHFSNGIKSLLPERFSTSDIKWLWNRVKDHHDYISYSQFALNFDKKSNNYLTQPARPKTAAA